MPAGRRWAAALLAMAVGACANNPAPRGWLPTPKEIPHHTRGAWIVVRARGGTILAGELIAISDKRVHVLAGDVLRGMPVDDVRRATLALHESRANEMAGASLLVLTHGWFLVFTLPLWIATTAGASREGLLSADRKSLPSLAKYARFPQGLPPGLDPGALEDRWPSPSRVPPPRS